jgi:hypothetical protein
MGNKIRDLPARSIVPQPTTLPRAPHSQIKIFKMALMWLPLLKSAHSLGPPQISFVEDSGQMESIRMGWPP